MFSMLLTGRPNVDWCESHKYDQDHQEGSGTGFIEEDKPNFTGPFFSKSKAEELLKEFENLCTLRVRMPISSDLSNPRNFTAKLFSQYNKVVDIRRC
ncbi:hypothetical protein NC651_037861 [Populus alba x Populus x berolinensis]|nr:hypothetical protein NC651_037861 [Populus alba x Populus x berolinensis]